MISDIRPVYHKKTHSRDHRLAYIQVKRVSYEDGEPVIGDWEAVESISVEDVKDD